MSEDELRLELAIFLYKQERMTIAQAAEFVNLPAFLFQKGLAKRKVSVNYSSKDSHDDLETLGLR